MAILKELTKYSNAVIAGKIIACQKHTWACLRFLNDLKRRDNDDEWRWDFDEGKAERYFQWMREFKHTKGELAGQRKEPCDYELFVYGNIYGWVDSSKPEIRRFRQTYEQLGRKNAKSQDKAIQALYEMSAFGEPAAEVYVAASKKTQTRFVWDEAKRICQNSVFKNLFTYKYDNATGESVIKHIKSGSIFARLSKDDEKKGDGSNPHFGILDEYHLHETTEFYDILKSGMKTRRNPLLSIITTAGLDLNNPCYRVEYNYISQILDPNSPVENERYFAMVCELDRNETQDVITTADGRQIEPGGIIDELGTDEAIMKSNPVTGWSETVRENIREETRTAQTVPEKMRSTMTKTYNVWVQNRPVGYMDMTRWANCKVTSEKLREAIAEKAGGRCYIGLDLSAKEDLTSATLIFPFVEDGATKYAIESHSFVPEEKYHEKIRTDRVPYDVWRRNGFLTVTDGAVVDHIAVIRNVIDTCNEYGWLPVEFDLDPWGATSITPELMNEGYKVVEVRQGLITLAGPTKAFREAVSARRVIHADNPVLTWAVGNAITRSDHNENIMLDKQKARHRIDPIAAGITAFTRALADVGEAAEGEYETGWGAMFV